jgi:glucose-1-phosphate cytidylyltransferase
MKVVILAGGYGTRLAEETTVKPKPMVEIGGRPILWHIMKHYGFFGFREFFVALGYKGEVIKRYFMDYYPLHGNLTINLANGGVQMYGDKPEDWIVHLIDTGKDTLTGGRVKRLESCLRHETFMVTYGDGVSDVDLVELLRFHRSHGRVATLTAVRPPGRYGAVTFDGDRVAQFTEKLQSAEGWINGGYFVFEPHIFNYLKGDDTYLEVGVLEHLAADGQLMAYRHEGFWQCMDTLRDKQRLEAWWEAGQAAWKVWEG